MGDKYFAAMSEAEGIGPEIFKKIDDGYQYLQDTSLWDRIFRSKATYWGLSANQNGAVSHRISPGGDEGELSLTRANHYRNIGQHLLMLTVSQRPAPQPIASNTDAKTHEQVSLASGLLDYYSRDKRVERYLKTAAEHAIVFGEGYVHMEWDVTLGKAIGVAGGQQINEGDIRFSNPTIADVIKDPYRENGSDLDWIIVRYPVNKYELAAKYPEKEKQILGKETRDKEASNVNRISFIPSSFVGKTDDISVYRFYHRKSKAVPNGKMIELVSDDCILLNVDLPYRNIPVRRICPSELIGSSHGYTPMFDLLGIQEAIDALYSVVITNQKSFGVQNLMAPDGHNISVESISKGLNLITYDSKLGKPEALTLLSTPVEIFNFIHQLEALMETLSGINSTVRGNPEASLKSGSALALVQSQAIQFSSGLQSSYAQLVEDVYTDLLNMLKDYAKTKRVALIVGKYNRSMLKSFVGDNLEGIDRVVVDSGNPLSKTASGRIQIAQDLIQNQMIKTPEEYISVVTTGKLEHMTEGENSELILIRSENEKLAEGKPCPVTAVDAHRLHILEHKVVLASTETRENEAVVKATLDHIQQHIIALQSTDPNLLAMLGEQSLAMPPPSPETMAGGTPPGGQPPPGASQPVPSEAGPIPGEAAEPGLPTNPATGNTWDPLTGGGVIESPDA